MNAICVNKMGSYECECERGYRIAGSLLSGRKCTDINECAENVHECGNVAMCQNLPGGYGCLCESGYAWSKVSRTCEDVDECNQLQQSPIDGQYLHRSQVCDDYSICRNLNGSFECLCKPGWTRTIEFDSCVG